MDATNGELMSGVVDARDGGEAAMDLAGKRVTVMGLGRFGGGVGVTRWLAAQGADVLVTDMEPAERLRDSVGGIAGLVDRGSVRLRLGEHNVSDFTKCDLVVANVAVPKPWENRFLRAAEAAGIPVTTEIAMFIERLPEGSRRRTVGVTGSVGKSTTTAMIHHAMSAAAKARGERVLLGGNIGVSLLSELGNIDDRTWLVLELSSAMLYWIERVLASRARTWSPRVAVVTNIAANHLDWHGAFDHYAESKQALVRHQRPGDAAVLGESVWAWRNLSAAGDAAVKVDGGAFSLPLAVPGAHNRENAAAAAAAVRKAMPWADAAVVDSAIAAFGGLPHRLQLVAEKHLHGEQLEPVRFYNDSKSTTPEACLKALNALADMPSLGRGRIHLIAGGYDKKADLSPIAMAAGELRGLYTIGATGPSLAAMSAGGVECGTLEHAVEQARVRMKPGDALLLSPGCASWDQFVNYEQRGDVFVRLVEALK